MDEWVIYGSRSCPFTIKSMNILRNKKIPYAFIDVSNEKDRQKIIAKSKQKTIPVIYKKGRLLGGCSDLEKYFVNRT